ncbi:hypothetical protein ACQ4LE_002000 [Meloidogyne hapla]|uniref:Uncharacterized protein n=1 Tax=Meloidogyne hapla TaxID=6305 RepID=A0A1I8BRT2_MELHA
MDASGSSNNGSNNNSSSGLPSIPSPIIDPILETQTFEGELTLRELVGQIEDRLDTRVISLFSGCLSVYTMNPLPGYIDHLVSEAVQQAELAASRRYEAVWETIVNGVFNNVRFGPICEECEETSLLESEGGIHQSHQICQHISVNKSVSKTSKVARVNSRLRVFGRRAKRSRKIFRLLNTRIRFMASCMNNQGRVKNVDVLWSPNGNFGPRPPPPPEEE